MENHFVYNPDVYPNGWNEVSAENIEEAWFTSEDGVQLHGLYAIHSNPRALILFAHGRSGNVTTPIEKLIRFVERHQVSVLVFDYRGFGKSEGTPDEQGLHFDARAARRWLADREGIDESDIILMGRSLGAAVAVELAASDGAKGLILESAFTSLPDVISHHVPLVPADKFIASRFDSLARLADFDGPVLICHGTKDKLVPWHQGRKLFHAAAGPKHLVSIPNGTHFSAPTTEYNVLLSQFIDDVNRKRR